MFDQTIPQPRSSRQYSTSETDMKHILAIEKITSQAALVENMVMETQDSNKANMHHEQ